MASLLECHVGLAVRPWVFWNTHVCFGRHTQQPANDILVVAAIAKIS